MMRTVVDLTDDQIARLQQVTERDGISRGEAIRRAVDAAYAGVAVAGSCGAREAAFGLWKGRKIDALHYVDKVRDEWEGPRKRLKK